MADMREVGRAAVRVVANARELTALLSDDGPPFKLDGLPLGDAAEDVLLRMHDHLNDIDRAYDR